jgi:hypothetical protein
MRLVTDGTGLTENARLDFLGNWDDSRSMRRIMTLLLCLLGMGVISHSFADVLIVADEFPAMQTLARRMKVQENIASQIVAQKDMPTDLKAFSAVIVYIHRSLDGTVEKALVDYAEQGGKLIALHHSISSGKRTNECWFSSLGISLPKGNPEQGGYQWTEGVVMDIVNIAPWHFINTNKVGWDHKTAFAGPLTTPTEKQLPSFTLHETEVYLNHTFIGPRTVFLGIKYQDAKTGKTWMQETAGWYRPVGKGTVFYLLPGHSVREFAHPAYVRIVLNALIYRSTDSSF